MLLDDQGRLRDFVALGWTASNISGLSITIGSQLIQPAASGHWSGNGIIGGTRGIPTSTTDSWRRVGIADANSAADWQWAQHGTTFGVSNPGLFLPWEVATPLNISPGTVPFVAGAHSGSFTIGEAGTDIKITADDGAGRRGSSAAFTVLDPAADGDGDGMPNFWEFTHGFDLENPADGSLDDDEDGQSNLAEYQAGTDPSSAASVFQLTSHFLDPVENEFHLNWTCVAGKTYQVKSSPDLVTWSLVESLVAGSTGTMGHQVEVPTGENRFFRVEINP